MYWSPARTATSLNFTYHSNPFAVILAPNAFMLATSPAVEASAIESLRQEELEEARAVQI
jgi:hypothetical protein